MLVTNALIDKSICNEFYFIRECIESFSKTFADAKEKKKRKKSSSAFHLTSARHILFALQPNNIYLAFVCYSNGYIVATPVHDLSNKTCMRMNLKLLLHIIYNIINVRRQTY